MFCVATLISLLPRLTIRGREVSEVIKVCIYIKVLVPSSVSCGVRSSGLVTAELSTHSAIFCFANESLLYKDCC